MGDKVGEKPGGAQRRRFLAIREKPQGGGVQTPPAGRRLISYWMRWSWLALHDAYTEMQYRTYSWYDKPLRQSGQDGVWDHALAYPGVRFGRG